MKTNLSLTFMLLLVLASGAMAQKKEKYNVYLNYEKNGNDVIIDTSFATKEEMEAFMKSQEVSMTEIPDMPGLPEIEIPELPDLDKMMIQIEGKEIPAVEKEKIRAELKQARKEMERARFEMNDHKKELEKARKEMKRVRVVVGDSGKTNYKYIYHHHDKADKTEGKRKMIIVEVEGDNEDSQFEYKIFKAPCDSVIFFDGKEEGHLKVRTKTIIPSNEPEMVAAAPAPKAEEKVQSAAQATTTTDYKLATTEFALYPNPTQGKINLSFKVEETTPVEVRLLDAGGKVIVDETVETANGYVNKEFDIEGKARGTYLLQLKQGDKWRHEKVVLR